MKRINNLYEETYKIDNIINMTDKVCTRTKNKKKVYNFELYKFEHIFNIYRRLYTKDINISKYNIFMINDPKCRIIMAEELEDKIINHLIADYILVKVFEPLYTNSMCATRVGYGTIYGVKLLKKYLNEIKFKYNNFYVLKIDISKYFYNIDHDVLKSILSKKIKDKDALNILYSIIDSTNYDYVNESIIKLKNNRIKYLNCLNISNKDKLINEINEIPLYKYGKGLALGNQTSQAFGLIYLYEINHYIREKLHIKYLINYMDDFVILHHDKNYLKYCLDKISNKLKEDYKLNINIKKTRIDNISNGIDFLGYHFFCKNNHVIIKLRDRTKKNIKRKIKKFKNNNSDSLKRSLKSYNGILKWSNCKSLFDKTLKEFFMLDKYYKYRLDYREYVIFIKSGVFYECIARDALIINKLFNYKIKKISNTFKVGFPINNINEVINILKEKSINYIIINGDEVTDKFESKLNNYKDYNFDIDNILYNYLLIEQINKYLNDNIMMVGIEEQLKQILNILKS